MLPVGTIHGTPEGHEAGCKGDRAHCPAEVQHGMSCTSAFVRSTTTPDRYFKAKARDPRPAAIARTLGYKPHTPAPTVGVNPRARAAKRIAESTAEAPADAPPTEQTAPVAVVMCAPSDPEPAKPKPTRKKAAAPSLPSPSKLMRAWAQENNLPCPVHGPVPRLIQEAYANRPLADPTTDPGNAPADAGELDRARSIAARLWDELETAERERQTAQRALEFVLAQWGAARDEPSALEARVLDTLGFIDRTIDGNETSNPNLPWKNSEVLQMLQMIRDRIIGNTTPAGQSNV